MISMSLLLLENKPVPDDTIYQNATGVMPTSGSIPWGGRRGGGKKDLRGGRAEELDF